MAILQRIRTSIAELSKQQFYQLLIGVSIIFCILYGLFIWFYYHKTGLIQEHISMINEQRVATKKLLSRVQRVISQRKEVDEILAQDPNFKIASYFQELLSKLNLLNKKVGHETNSIDENGGYRTDTLTAKLSDLSMQELALLLQELEKNKRIYLKEVDIKKSKKNGGSLDVSISFATLQTINKSLSTQGV